VRIYATAVGFGYLLTPDSIRGKKVRPGAVGPDARKPSGPGPTPTLMYAKKGSHLAM